MEKFNGDANLVTLEEAKQWLRSKVYDGAECPCCTQLAKVYRRKLNRGMVTGLAEFYCHVRGDTTLYAHVPSTGDLARLGGDWAKLLHWGLIEESDEEREDGGRAGWWRISEKGCQFVRGQIEVPSHGFFYNGRLLKLDTDKHVRIPDVAAEGFDLQELLESYDQR